MKGRLQTALYRAGQLRVLSITLMLSFVPATAYAQTQALLLYDKLTFVGCINCSPYDPAAVCNEYGVHGSKYQMNSIWNQYGTYGSKYRTESPWNAYGAGLKVVDENGAFYGQFSVGYAGRTSPVELIRAIAQAYETLDGDIDVLRELMCEN